MKLQKLVVMSTLLFATHSLYAEELGAEPKRKPALIKSTTAKPIAQPQVEIAPVQKEEPAAPPEVTASVNIIRFEVVGNTLLTPQKIDSLLNPFKGNNKNYADIQRALEALEGAYRDAGYSSVNVSTPEQDITDGVVVFIVSQAVIQSIHIDGNKYYDEANIKRALPSLKEGSIPSARRLAQNLRLANENPTRNLEVVLALGDEEGKIDAKVKVKDQSPHKLFITLDNTGNLSTGSYRTGVGYQNNNLFNRDQAITMNAMTSPDHVKQVEQLSTSYRLPIYDWGDSVDLSAAYSNTDAGTTTIGGAGGPILSFNGQGKIFSSRYNVYLPRQGDYSSKLAFGLDYRAFINNCLINGAAICGGSGENLTVHPFTLSYDAQISKPTMMMDFGASLERNLPFGASGNSDTFDKVRMGTQADYSVLRLNGSLSGIFTPAWQYRLASNMQYVSNAVIAQESFGLVGANAVRGFREREVFSADRGYVINAEVYAPELAGKIKLEDSSLRPVIFMDHGSSYGLAASTSETTSKNSVTSAGVGLRFSFHKNWMAKLDAARVINISDNTSNITKGTQFGHFSLMANW